MLKKLQDVGASASALKWFKDYLSDKKQTVRIGSAVSDPIVSGVPQGSILVSLLFTLQEFYLSLLGKDLILVPTVKDLGVTFDKNLTFNNSIAKTVSSCMSTLRLINRVKHAFKKELLVKMINALVFSKLYYCSSVWSNTTDTNIKKLQCVQSFAAWIISNTGKYDHITPVLKSVKWIPVQTNLYFRDAVLIFKCMAGIIPEYVWRGK